MTYSFERNNVRRSAMVKPSIYGGGGTVGSEMAEVGKRSRKALNRLVQCIPKPIVLFNGCCRSEPAVGKIGGISGF